MGGHQQAGHAEAAGRALSALRKQCLSSPLRAGDPRGVAALDHPGRLAALVQVLGFGLALAAAGTLIQRGQISLASLAVLIPGMALLSGMLGSLIYHYRELLESLTYAETLFEFLTTQTFDGHRAVLPAP